MLTIIIRGESGAGKSFALRQVILPALIAAGYSVSDIDEDARDGSMLAVSAVVEPPARK